MAKAVLRAMQVRAPGLKRARYAFQRGLIHWLRRPVEPVFSTLPRLPLADGPLLDIGANRGLAIESMRLALPGRRILAFEANPLLAAELRQLYCGDAAIEVRAIALGRSQEIRDLWIPEYDGYLFDGLASFHREDALAWFDRSKIFGFRANLLSARRVDCEVRPLDSFDLCPAFLKIDVQGAEQDVLVGAAETIARSRPVLIIELEQNIGPVIELLKALDYIQASLASTAKIQADANAIFLPIEKVDRVGRDVSVWGRTDLVGLAPANSRTTA